MFVLQAPLLFFNPHEAAVVDAMTARIIPRESGSPGAREARAIIYIDRALAGYFSSLQVFYREGIEMIDAQTKSRFAKSFANATEAEQDEVLRAIERSQIFSVVYEHTIEGTFGVIQFMAGIMTPWVGNSSDSLALNTAIRNPKWPRVSMPDRFLSSHFLILQSLHEKKY